MLIHPQINPVALQLGPLAIHWYGLTYLAAFGLFIFLGFRRLKHPPFAAIKGEGAWVRKDVEDILFLGVLGVILGAAYLLWFYERAIFGKVTKPENERLPDLNGRELAVALPLVALIFWIGLYPSPFLHRINGSVEALHARLHPATAAAGAGTGRAEATAVPASAFEEAR